MQATLLHSYTDCLGSDEMQVGLDQLFLRLFKKILFLIESGDCDKIIILISQSAIDLFRSLVPKEIIQIIALQIKENHSKLSLSQIDEKILSDFYIN